jgi:hypothetical protein
MTKSWLADQLDSLEERIDVLQEEARQVIAETPATDEQLDRAKGWYGRDRYVLIRPDGAPAFGFPYPTSAYISFVQRPTALSKLSRALPGTRLLDKRTGEIVTQAQVAAGEVK